MERICKRVKLAGITGKLRNIFRRNRSEPSLSFDHLFQSTPLNIINEGPEYIDPPVEFQQTFPAQLIPQETFDVSQLNRPADHGPIIPGSLINQGVATGRVRETCIYEQTLPNQQVPLPLQQFHKHKTVRVESKYRLPNRTKYWKIYIQHEYTIVTRDTSQFEYRAVRN